MERLTTKTATIISCDEGRNLTAILDDGQKIMIPSGEVHKDASTYDFRRHIGREMDVVNTHRISAERLPIYSHRLVEENDLEWLHYNFKNGIRNTYWAHYRGMTSNGTLAFYKIGDTSINGAIALKDFSLNHMGSFNDCVMPASIQVVITEIQDGRIQLSSIPGFFGFEETVNMLKLHPGSSPVGKATRRIGDSARTIVMLTPNVATLVDGGFEGADVKVLVTNINYEKRKIKSRLDSVLEMPGKRKIDYNQYVSQKRLPDFLLLEDYKDEQGYFKRRSSTSSQNVGCSLSCNENAGGTSEEQGKSPLSLFGRLLSSIAS